MAMSRQQDMRADGRIRKTFRIDPDLDERFREYCRVRTLLQERLVEALLYWMIIENGLSAAQRDGLLQRVDAWQRGDRPESVKPEMVPITAEEVKLLADRLAAMADKAAAPGPSPERVEQEVHAERAQAKRPQRGKRRAGH